MLGKMDVLYERKLFDTEGSHDTNRSAAAMLRQSTAERNYYALRKRRKSHWERIHGAQRCQSINDAGGGGGGCSGGGAGIGTASATGANDSLPGNGITVEIGRTAAKASALVKTSQQLSNATAPNTFNSTNVCIICRQSIGECCPRCNESYATSSSNNKNNHTNNTESKSNRRASLAMGTKTKSVNSTTIATETTGLATTSQSQSALATSAIGCSQQQNSYRIATRATARTFQKHRETQSTTSRTADALSGNANGNASAVTKVVSYSTASLTSSTSTLASPASPASQTTSTCTSASTLTSTSTSTSTSASRSTSTSASISTTTSTLASASAAPSTTTSASTTTSTTTTLSTTTTTRMKAMLLPAQITAHSNPACDSDAVRTFEWWPFLDKLFNFSCNRNRKSNKRQQKQQQRPPLIRLIQNCCNSYYNTNIFYASPKQQLSPQTHQTQQQQQQQQQQQPHQQPKQLHKAEQQKQNQQQQQHQQQLNNYYNTNSNSSNKKCLQHHLQQLRTHHCNSNNKSSISQHLRQFKMPNLSLLYMILTILSFLSLILPSINAQTSNALAPFVAPSAPSSASLTAALRARLDTTNATTSPSQVTLSRNETVCRSLDIRNTPSELNHLKNCTVIEGFLLITLMNTHNPQEFNQSFPLLTEVTEFIIIYRVHILRSLSQLFPNLSVIRGTTLFEGYAFIVYSNPHLEDLGLSKLTTISRGGVRIESNVMLCYVKTIAWKRVLATESEITLENNRKLIECPKCPGDTKIGSLEGADSEKVCKEFDGQRRCWNSKTCQKICPDNCPNNCDDKGNCCHDACVGGCETNNSNVCISCRHFSIYNNSCIDKCPPNYFSYLNRRCITAEECIRIGTKFENNKSQKIVPYDGKCSTRCPTGYNKIGTTCKACGDNCVMKCVGGLIDSVERAKDFLGCTHIIKNGLTISIKRGGRHLMEELEYGLSAIQVINTYLKIQGTFGMISLAFFKHLQSIGGDPLYEDKFALYALENNDLETLWAANQTVRIKKGRVFFHFNPKLCFSEIERLLPMMKDNAPFDKNEVASDSNGHKGSCNTEMLVVKMTKIASRVAIANIVNPLKFDDERTFIGYQYFFMEAKYQNATKYSQRVCDDGWIVSDPTKEKHYIFINLKPFTQYAYYVKTWTISSEKRNAQSPIQYFKTKSAQPKFVQALNAYAPSNSEIKVSWAPPLIPQGNLIIYRIRATLDKRSQVLQSRNYCKDPAQIDKDEESKDPTRDSQLAVTDQPPNGTNCKCDKEKSPNHDVDTSEATILAGIDFENTLQNFIYVKNSNESDSDKSRRGEDETAASLSDMDAKRRRRHSEGLPEESFLRRHMRAVPDELETAIITTTGRTESSTGETSITTIAPLTDAQNVTYNISRMDPTDTYYEFILVNVSVSTTSYLFTNLKHFSIYQLGVEACREPEDGASEKECSDIRIRYVRTKKKEGVDLVQNIVAELEATNTTRPSLRLRWDAPEEPNGDVVSYTISYILMAQDAVEEKRCITEVDYRNMTKGYLLSGLQTGNYSIKVRANSLAGDGIYSNPVYKYIPAKKLSGVIIAIICISSILALALVGVAYCYIRKRYAPPKDLKIFPTVNPYYISLQYIPDDWEVARDRVIQLSPLGQGSFGMVYEGLLKGHNNSNEDTPCAIKTVNENATDRERMNFLNEASVMKQFDTYHVVRLLGVCSVGQPALVIMELMKNGDLKLYLRAHRPDERDGDSTLPFIRGEPALQPPPLSRIFQMAVEIADGMAYLAFKKFVHRDLAARNCMVASDLTVKIGDFGMTRDIYETDYYRKGTKGLLPVRWMPPESLRDGVYSTASDVFSYGVVLWEIVTLASQPYPGYSNDQVLRFVIEGGVMERPENCPDKIYEIMQQCWEHRPSKRPSFLKIIRMLLDYVDSDNDGYLQQFRDVSFYYSSEGLQEREKERAGMHHSGDIFNDHDNEMDDLTTPLRMNEYTDYKLNLDILPSHEHARKSRMAIDDDQPHSPYSLASAIVVSSTPDGQSKNSYNLSQMSHNNPTLLSSVPSTSAGIISGGSHSHSHQLQHPRHPHNIGRYGQYPSGEEASAYVQPDYDPRTRFDSATEDEQLGATGKSMETDERGYEMYDPSPNYRPFAPPGAAVDEEDFGFRVEGSDKDGRYLMPGKKSHQREPLIMPMSSSMPDDVKNAPMASSLHPSTASAASSNASSTATTTGGRSYLKKRFGNINLRFFNHKRSGSNASHKSTSSNPNTTTGGSSNSNLAVGVSGRGKSMSGQNLGTIESGGSGSAGSYCPAPRFFTPAVKGGAAIADTSNTSDNPNYRLLDETTNASCATTEAEHTTAGGPSTSTPAKSSPTTRTKPTSGFASSGNPNYHRLDESLNTTLTPDKPTTAVGSGATTSGATRTTQPSEPPRMSDNPNYVMMSEPALMPPAQPPHASSTSPIAFANMSENPNYQVMGPGHLHSNQGSSTSSLGGDLDEELDDNIKATEGDDEDKDDEPTDHIKMELLGRDRGAAATAAAKSKRSQPEWQSSRPRNFSLKEEWLRGQEQRSYRSDLPPPNGFIGASGVVEPEKQPEQSKRKLDVGGDTHPHISTQRHAHI